MGIHTTLMRYLSQEFTCRAVAGSTAVLLGRRLFSNCCAPKSFPRKAGARDSCQVSYHNNLSPCSGQPRGVASWRGGKLSQQLHVPTNTQYARECQFKQCCVTRLVAFSSAGDMKNTHQPSWLNSSTPQTSTVLRTLLGSHSETICRRGISTTQRSCSCLLG